MQRKSDLPTVKANFLKAWNRIAEICEGQRNSMKEKIVEVWADLTLTPPYILLLLGGNSREESCRVLDPSEGYKEIFAGEDYNQAQLWLLEDEYEPLGCADEDQQDLEEAMGDAGTPCFGETQPMTLKSYLKLQYTISLYAEEEGGYVACIYDLPGCMAQGETPDEILMNINEARQLWIESAFDSGKPIPLPRDC